MQKYGCLLLIDSIWLASSLIGQVHQNNRSGFAFTITLISSYKTSIYTNLTCSSPTARLISIPGAVACSTFLRPLAAIETYEHIYTLREVDPCNHSLVRLTH